MEHYYSHILSGNIHSQTRDNCNFGVKNICWRSKSLLQIILFYVTHLPDEIMFKAKDVTHKNREIQFVLSIKPKLLPSNNISENNFIHPLQRLMTFPFKLFGEFAYGKFFNLLDKEPVPIPRLKMLQNLPMPNW